MDNLACSAIILIIFLHLVKNVLMVCGFVRICREKFFFGTIHII